MKDINPKRNYTQTIEYLYNFLPVFHHVGSSAYKPGLDNTVQLMNKLDNPHNKFRSIHIAGTNGKGSVSNFLTAILQKAGYKVGLYTSPHLVHFGERIRVNGEMINEQYVVDFVAENHHTFSEIQPSFFEATMAMAFKYFADNQVDIAVIEVGLGGRLDSTNIITPMLSVITNIGFDHVGFLGDTLDKIAYEKAGIIKTNIPVVVGETLPDTKPVFEQKALQENAPITFAEDNYVFKIQGIDKDKMEVINENHLSFKTALCGNYQLKNIATVVESVEQLRKLDFDISENALRKGLEFVTTITGLQGRWQKINFAPLTILDTAHNVDGIKWVVEQIKAQKYKTLHIVIGMVNDKDVASVLSLLPPNAKYYFTQASIFRALPATELMQKAFIYGLVGESYTSVEQSISAAVAVADKDDFIFIGGSNFVVGEAISHFCK